MCQKKKGGEVMQESLDESLDFPLNHMVGKESPSHRTLRTLASWPGQNGMWMWTSLAQAKCEYVKFSFGVQSLLWDGWHTRHHSVENLSILLAGICVHKTISWFYGTPHIDRLQGVNTPNRFSKVFPGPDIIIAHSTWMKLMLIMIWLLK